MNVKTSLFAAALIALPMAAFAEINGSTPIPLHIPDPQIEAQLKRCVVDPAMADHANSSKWLACGKPLTAYLVSHGERLGEAFNYASSATVDRWARERFGVTTSVPYKISPYDKVTIDHINAACAGRGVECAYDPTNWK